MSTTYKLYERIIRKVIKDNIRVSDNNDKLDVASALKASIMIITANETSTGTWVLITIYLTHREGGHLISNITCYIANFYVFHYSNSLEISRN